MSSPATKRLKRSQLMVHIREMRQLDLWNSRLKMITLFDKNRRGFTLFVCWPFSPNKLVESGLAMVLRVEETTPAVSVATLDTTSPVPTTTSVVIEPTFLTPSTPVSITSTSPSAALPSRDPTIEPFPTGQFTPTITTVQLWHLS